MKCAGGVVRGSDKLFMHEKYKAMRNWHNCFVLECGRNSLASASQIKRLAGTHRPSLAFAGRSSQKMTLTYYTKVKIPGATPGVFDMISAKPFETPCNPHSIPFSRPNRSRVSDPQRMTMTEGLFAERSDYSQPVGHRLWEKLLHYGTTLLILSAALRVQTPALGGASRRIDRRSAGNHR